MIDLIAAAIITIGHKPGGGSGHSHHGKHAGYQVIEGCEWSGDEWDYPDGSLCRGTGEDPTVDNAGLPACADGRVATPQQRFGTLTYQCVTV